jgi:hypothetical protein
MLLCSPANAPEFRAGVTKLRNVSSRFARPLNSLPPPQHWHPTGAMQSIASHIVRDTASSEAARRADQVAGRRLL